MHVPRVPAAGVLQRHMRPRLQVGKVERGHVLRRDLRSLRRGRVLREASALGVRKLRDAKGTITIDTSAAFTDPSEKLARELSTFECVERAFAIYGQSAADGYVVAENVRGETIRHVLYNRDEGGWQTSGAPRPWEKDIPVGKKHDVYDDDEDERDEDRMSYRKLMTLVENLGWNFDTGPHAKHERRGLLAKLFGA
jgi:hypothetical protein